MWREKKFNAIGHEFRTPNINVCESLINKRSTVAGSNIKKKKKKNIWHYLHKENFTLIQ